MIEPDLEGIRLLRRPRPAPLHSTTEDAVVGPPEGVMFINDDVVDLARTPEHRPCPLQRRRQGRRPLSDPLAGVRRETNDPSPYRGDHPSIVAPRGVSTADGADEE